jgi:hypothetical protein
MPWLRVRVRPIDWERVGWRKRFEEDILKAGWRVAAIEPPDGNRSEYVVSLERRDERPGE